MIYKFGYCVRKKQAFLVLIALILVFVEVLIWVGEIFLTDEREEYF